MQQADTIGSETARAATFFQEQLHTFGHTEFDRGEYRIHQSVYIDRFITDPDSVGFDLGQVEYIVYQLHQQQIIGLDDLIIFPTLLIRIGKSHQFGKTGDRIQRGADLMAHIRQILGLHLIGKLRLVLGFFQVQLLPFAFLYVDRTSQDHKHPSPFIPFVDGCRRFTPVVMIHSRVFHTQLDFHFRYLSRT